MRHFLEFEKTIADLESKIEELRHLSDGDGISIAEEVGKLQNQVNKQLKQTYERLTPWQRVQVARHPNRPHSSDYIKNLITDFTPLAGDRAYAEDRAIIAGIGRFRGWSTIIIGHEKGVDTDGRIVHNFGMARPEGYRKAQRVMELADRFQLPIITFIDTPGAYPGAGAEERGQAESIAETIRSCMSVRVPFISVVIGEGGSGGAIALAAANTVLMLEHSVYSVISPEGCASILWRDSDKSLAAAEALKITASDLLGFSIIDRIIYEALGGAHRDTKKITSIVGDALDEELYELRKLDGDTLKKHRREKFLNMGRANLI